MPDGGFSAFADWLRSARRGVTVAHGLERRADNFLALRILAAVMVIYGHASHLAPAVSSKDIFVRWHWGIYSGDIAVDIFFLISGFLVTGSFLRKRDLYAFAKARFLRLMPGFALNLTGLALVYGLFFTTLPALEYLRNPEVWHYIGKNLKLGTDMVWRLPGVFEQGVKVATINGAQWTLPAEARMYVLLGIIGALGALSSRWVASVVLAGLLLLGWFAPHWIPLPSIFLRLAGYFALGVLIYIHRERLRISLDVIVALIVLAVFMRSSALYPVAFALALSTAVFGLAYLTRPMPWLDRWGDPSYGVYLWGWPIQQVVAYFIPGAGLGLHVGLAVVLALATGYASWHFLERHALRLK
jgi:peptidoglycan/LPS O-acetylase OafA/YrhL